MAKNRTFWDKFWRDEHGNDVIWQRPNKLLLLWAICSIITVVMRGGMVEEIISWLGWVSIVLWAGLEVWWGVNYFRRLLGLMVLFMVIFSRF